MTFDERSDFKKGEAFFEDARERAESSRSDFKKGEAFFEDARERAAFRLQNVE